MRARGQTARLLVACGLCLTGLGGCGGVGNDTVVLSVGSHSFTKAAVEHWTSVIKRGGAFSGFRGAPAHGTPTQRAMTLLITSHWLIDEAARVGVAAPASTVEHALTEREQSAGFHKSLRATGQTVADVELEMKAELAGEAIREALAIRAERFSHGELVAYYRANPLMFSELEVRVTDLVENQPSRAAAAALVRRIGIGRRFAKLAFHEQVSRTGGFMSTPEKVKVVNAIFAAQPGVVSEPMKLNGNWAVFVVRKIVPPALKPLASVHSEVAEHLDLVRQHQIQATFDSEYRKRGSAATRCHAGYVAPGCPQFTGPLEAYEDPFSRRAHPLLSERTVTG